MAVFVSWRGSDREVKNKLVDRLRQELDPGIEIWESDEGCKSDFSAECMEAIEKSEVFVIILSDAAMEPSYVFNELLKARQMEMQGKLNIVLFKITDSPMKHNFEANLNHISDANHVGRMNGDDSGFDSVAVKVKSLINRRRNNNPEKPYDVIKPIVEGLPLCAPEYFAEGSRDDVFANFTEAFNKSNIVFTTKMSGYGRKSAAYMYARLHSSEYEEIKVLRFFSGSLRKFLTDGVEFTNVNDNVFDNLNEEKTILKVVEFLAKLDSKTLLIVPNVVIEDTDDKSILEAISGIGARVIFIAQSVPDSVSRVFPVVSVGRMKNEYLREIFFNYYEEAGEEDKETLTEPLDEFFDAIDGHTKTVELTAVALSEELGVYPEDIPEILKKICQGGGDELSERISYLIADLFDTASFTDVEKKILYITSLVAAVPMDEKEYSELLKKCGASDAKAFRRLVDLKWIDFDRMSHTVCMDKFLITVCEMKNLKDIDILANCLTFFNDILINGVKRIEIGTKFYATCVRTAELLNVAGAPRTAEFLVTSFTSDGVTYLEKDYVKELLDDVEDELNGIEDETLEDAVSGFYMIARTLCQQSLMLVENVHGGPDINMTVEAVLKNYAGLLGDLTEASGVGIESLPGYDELPEIIKGIVHAVSEAKVEDVLSLFLRINSEDLKELKRWQQSCDEDDILRSVVDNFLCYLPNNIMDSFSTNSYVCVKVCEKKLLWTSYYSDFRSPYDAVVTYFRYADSMADLGRDEDEVIEAYETGMGYFKGLFAGKSLTESERTHVVAEYLYSYCSFLKNNDIADDCKKIIDLITKVKIVGDEGVAVLADTYSLISEILLKSFSTAEWEAFYLKLDLKALRSFAASDDNDRRAENIVAVADELDEMYSLLQGEKENGRLDNEPVEYMSYYETFAKKNVKKGLIKKYMDIANSVLAKDLSNLSDEDVLREFTALRKSGIQVNSVLKCAEKAFSLINEAVKRTLGYSLHFVQYVGALAIVEGNISEMQNGEGKTVTIALAAALLSITGKKVNILDSSLYLTRRNFRWMYDVYEMLGLKSGIIDHDISKELTTPGKREEYNSYDIIYVQIGGGMFTDISINVSPYLDRLPHDIVIVDEADQLMISEGTLKYSSVRDKRDGINIYGHIADLIKSIDKDRDVYFKLDAKKNLIITEKMYEAAERFFDMQYETSGTKFREQSKSLIRECIWAFYVMQRDVDYFIQNGKVLREDTYNGTFGSFSKSTDYFLRVKEDLSIDEANYNEKLVSDMYDVMEYIKQYSFICGASATACSMAREFKEAYGMEVVSIPTEKPVQRIDYPPVLLAKKEYKIKRIINEVRERIKTSQPILIVTGSVQESESISRHLFKAGIVHELLNAKNAEDQAELLSMAGSLGRVTVTTAMANRGVDIRLGGNAEELAKDALLKSGISLEDFESMYSSNKREEVGYVKIEYLKALKRFREITEPQKAEVEELGGLCVIGTECFDDLRIEQQMRGRAGRQGSKGESMLFYSLEDDALQVLLSGGIMHMFDVGYEDVEISNGFITKSLERAREKIQNARFRQLVNDPQVEIVAEARKKFFGLKDKLSDSSIAKSVIKEFLASYTTYINMIKQYEKNPNGLYRVPFGKEYFDAHPGRHRDKEIGEMLYRAWLEEVPPMLISQSGEDRVDEFVCYGIRYGLCKRWAKYLESFETKKQDVNYGSNITENNKMKLLKDFSESLTKELIDECISVAINPKIISKK